MNLNYYWSVGYDNHVPTAPAVYKAEAGRPQVRHLPELHSEGPVINIFFSNLIKNKLLVGWRNMEVHLTIPLLKSVSLTIEKI